MQKWAWPCFFGGPYLKNPCKLKPKILFVFIVHVKVHLQFFKPKSDLVTGKIPELWLSSYGMTRVGMVQEIHGNHVVPYHPVEGEEKVFEVDWSTPFRRVPMIPELEKQLGVTFPPATEFGKPGRHALKSAML